MNKEENFIARVREERMLQRRIWGDVHDSRHSWMEWAALLGTYLGRYSDAARDGRGIYWKGEPYDITNAELMETALVKLGALALACYERI